MTRDELLELLHVQIRASDNLDGRDFLPFIRDGGRGELLGIQPRRNRGSKLKRQNKDGRISHVTGGVHVDGKPFPHSGEADPEARVSGELTLIIRVVGLSCCCFTVVGHFRRN